MTEAQVDAILYWLMAGTMVLTLVACIMMLIGCIWWMGSEFLGYCKRRYKFKINL